MKGAADPVEIVQGYGGSARATQVLQLTTRHRLETARLSGRLIRPRRGVYVLPGLPDAAVAAARAGGIVSDASAAQWWRLGLVAAPTVVHVTVPHDARPPQQEHVRYHWSRRPLGPGPATSVLQTVLDCAASMPFDEALPVADSALALRLVRPGELLAGAAGSPRTGRSRRLRVARLADGRAANAFESRLRALVLDAGLTGFQPQLEIRLTTGTVRVDLGDPERRIVIEADSYEHHGSRSALVGDCERYDELVADGWIVLRFAWEHVMFRPDWVQECVVRACRRPSRELVTYSTSGGLRSSGTSC